MMELLLKNGWLDEANKKVFDGKRRRPQLTKQQIKGILRLCASAVKSISTEDGVLYYVK